MDDKIKNALDIFNGSLMEKQNKIEKIAAVVVTYNRKELLKECLDAILCQTYPVNSIILIDNASNDGTSIFLEENGYLNNSIIDYMIMPKNIGASGGFYKGVKSGYEKGFDWLWLMDDDAELHYDSLKLLIKNREDNCVLAPIVISKDGKVLTNHRGAINYQNLFKKFILPIDENNLFNAQEISFTSFAGQLIPRGVIEEIGYPDSKFFIYYDDFEYCIRISRIRKIILVPESIIIHKEECSRLNKRKKFLWKISTTPRVDIYQYWRIYYSLRNLIYLAKKYQIGKIKFLYDLIIFIYKTIIGIFIYDDYRLIRIGLIIKAVKDGFSENLGANILPAVWKNKFKHV
jgi:rhamnopyranosyl-N-acetylglucosaminyl-diphospho-decaprenol beta-1,3/1,4-galactofuranosyltransferase